MELPLDDNFKIVDQYDLPSPNEQALAVPDEILCAVEQQIKAAGMYQRLISALLGLTKAHDWTRYGNKFRLTAAGATKVAQSFGLFISSPNVATERWQDNGQNYVRFTLTGTVRAAKYPHELPIVGSAEGSPGRGFMKTDGDILKKASANYTQRAITAIIGIGDITIDDLREAKKDEGFINAIPIVSFREGEQAKANMETRQNALADEVRALATKIAEASGGSLQDVITEASMFTGKDGKTVRMDANRLSEYKDTWLGKVKIKLAMMHEAILAQELPPIGDEFEGTSREYRL